LNAPVELLANIGLAQFFRSKRWLPYAAVVPFHKHNANEAFRFLLVIHKLLVDMVPRGFLPDAISTFVVECRLQK
jgi:hypothetical protein